MSGQVSRSNGVRTRPNMRKRARTDSNQQQIVDALRTAGVSIFFTGSLGCGFPDLVCGLRGQNFMLEIKDAAKSPSRRQLTLHEKEFHQQWRGHVDIVSTPEEALRAVGLL